MKTLIIFSIILSVFVARAENSIKWETKDIYKEKTKLGLVSGMVMQRQLVLGENKVQTMTLSFSELPMKDKMSEQQIADDLAESLGFGPWKIVADKKLSIFEKHWPEQNRYLRLMVKVDGKRVRLSLANTRTVFVYPALLEAEMLQRVWFDKTETTTASASLWDLLMDKAHAADYKLPSGIKLPSNIQRPNNIQIPAPVINVPNPAQYQTQIRGVTDNIGINSANSVRDGMESMSRAGDRIGSGIESAGRNIERAGDKVGDGMDKLADRLSLGNIAKAALVGTAVSVGVSALGNFLIDGTIKGVKALYYKISKQVDPETRARIEQMSQEGIQELEKRGQDITNLESTLDADLMALSYAKKGDPSTVLIDASKDMTDVERETERTRFIMASVGNAEVAKACQEKLQVLDTMMMALKRVGSNSPEMICSSIKSSLARYVQTQNALLIAKRNVQNHMLMIMTGNLQKTKDSILPLADVDTMENECIRGVSALEKQKNALSASAEVLANMQRNIDAMKARCQRTAALQKSLDPVQSLNDSIESANKDMEVSEFYYNNLIASECRESVKTNVCDGRPGFLNERTAYYNKQVAKYNEKCEAKAPASVQTVAAAAPVAESNAATPATAPVLGSNTKPGFFASIANGFKNFWGGLMRTQDSRSYSAADQVAN